MEPEVLPQYMRIAMCIASRIANGEYKENTRLSGRSTLSSEFRVSPETVRKAIRLLADMDIVQPREGSGTVVLSAENAEKYLETISVRREQVDLQGQLQKLFREYTQIGQQIYDIAGRLIAAGTSPLPSEQALPNYEVQVPVNSDKIGMSIGDLRFWQCTGATIVAVRRGQSVTVSPGPYVELQAGDVLVYVGAPGCKQAVEQLLGGEQTERSLYNIQQQIIMAVHAKELYVVAECLNAQLGDITGMTAMTKGMTNHSYQFTCKGERYILRIPGEGTLNLIDRKKEAAVYQAISGRGICDDVIYLNPQNGLKVTRFLDDVRNCDPYKERDIAAAMELLRSFHDMDIQVEHSFDLFGNIQYYEDLRDGVISEHGDYEETKAKVLSLRPYVEAHRERMCLTHIDAVPDNFLFYTRGGKRGLQLTDWEYAGMQDPHLDLAMFSIYSGYDRKRVDHLIDLYFRGECPRETRIKVYCYVAAAGLLWSNWCEYKRQLGVEYGDYALAQYNYARTYYGIVQEELSKS